MAGTAQVFAQVSRTYALAHHALHMHGTLHCSTWHGTNSMHRAHNDSTWRHITPSPNPL
jgi:hypothetical protein